MPVTFSIQPIIDAQTTALTTVINTARDNVKADNTTQITNQNTALTTAINAARDNVKADNATQAAAINGNTDTKTAAVTAAVDGKGVIKSIQRGKAVVTGSQGFRTLVVTIAAVNMAKAMLVVNGCSKGDSSEGLSTGDILTSTTIELGGWTSGSSYPVTVSWQVVEYF